MTITHSIKHAPVEVAACLRRRAKANHRSLQGELLAILEEAAEATGSAPLTVEGLLQEVEQSGFRTPATSADIAREQPHSR